MVYSNPLTESHVGLFLIQCLLIIILSRIVSWLFAKIQQPPVIAEIISGILLGPTAIGRIPGFTENIFPPESVTILSVFAQIGLIFFMFIIGLELDPTLFRSQIKSSAIISFFSIVFPFGLGIAASVYLAQIQETDWSYSLGIFIGVALAITAFPVLARILTSKKLLSTPIGILSIACAAINDICGWILLGLSVSLAGSGGNLDTLWTLIAAAGFVIVMLLIIRPLLNRVVGKVWRVDNNGGAPHSPSHLIMSAVVILLFIASFATEWIGIHAMFGAFTLGAIIPKTGAFNQAITEKIEDLVLVFLLPLYFVVSGLRTDLTTLNSGESWLGVLLIISCACVGKVVGAGVSAKFLGHNLKDSFSIGVLMNTRGLVELIVLNLGLDFGIIKIKVFGIMVLMAVFTTILTGPIISLLMRKPKKAGVLGADNFVFCTSSPNIAPSLIDLGFTMGNKYLVTTLTRRKLKKMYLLVLAEVNDRPSDFISQIRKDFSKEAFSHLTNQATQMKMKVSIKSIVTDNDNLSNEVISFSNSKGTGFLVIGQEGRFIQGRDGSLSADVLSQIIKNSKSHVGVFTDKSGSRGGTHRFKRILLVYFGGDNPNDQESLTVAEKMASTEGVQVTVIVFNNELYWKYKKEGMLDKNKYAQMVQSYPIPMGNVNSPTHSLYPSPVVGNSDVDSSTAEPSPNFINNTTPIPIPSSVAADNSNADQPSTLVPTVPVDIHQSHLDSVLNGVNKESINVIYKPRKSQLKVLLEECHNYDLLVVPYQEFKPATPFVFPSFSVPGIEMMKKSLSMVQLSKKSTNHLDHKDIGSPSVDHIHEYDDHPHIDPSRDRASSKSSATASTNQLHHRHLADSKQTNIAKEDNGKADLLSNDEINYGDQREIMAKSFSSSSDEEEHDPYWNQCPISTLVIYHKDTIIQNSSIDNSPNMNGGGANGGGANHDIENGHIELDPYEVDPNNLRVSLPGQEETNLRNFNEIANQDVENHNDNPLDTVLDIPKDKEA
ncbi:hypothetical protein CYY_008300 [Polysphondylium violaceum]|uniref:Cation/H+ exchanger transmembrane domain-containing protein n=1 Tax=Polysphondylium violaceum TaxID=133409 RepID=A0A8J4PNU3_9MYCE|nr:hypothetical protein CYY_008300 [Polysphondylium violaceum]